MPNPLLLALRDIGDIARRARSLREIVRALAPGEPLLLNDGPIPQQTAPRSAGEVAKELRLLKLQLEGSVIDERGRVDYGRLREHELAQSLAEASRLLRQVDPARLEGDMERIAFWVNTYNALALHGVLALNIQRSVMEVPSFFSRVAYRVGDGTFTLDDIENGVLRCNSPHPATRKRLFATDDPRLECCPERVDPRIHAALVCSSTSCPAVAFYDPERLDQQLNTASINFVTESVRIDARTSTVRAPITFYYYREDFGGHRELERFLVDHAEGALGAELESAFRAGFELSYDRYDWSLNGTA